MIRTHLIKSLYRNLLGPKNGSAEIMVQPFVNYQIGVLTSCFNSEKIDDKLISDPSEKNYNLIPRSAELIDSIKESDMDWPDTELDLDGSFTLGLSFVVKGNAPKIKICSTWGRYEYSEKLPTNLKVFKRKSNYYLTDWLDVNSSEKNDKKIKFAENDNGNIVTMHGVELHLRSTKHHRYENLWIVQVFLVNKTEFPTKDKSGKPKRQDETHRVFQPQIRINTDKDSSIGYLGDNNRKNSVDSLLYFKRRTKARGFQCGAIWKEIDPEQSIGDDGFHKFTWPDGESGHIPKEIVDDFTCPDVRTEYLPSYSILQPETSSREYDATYLSKQWNAKKIHEYLDKIKINYSKWIVLQRDNLEKLKEKVSNEMYTAGLKNLIKCDESLAEIKQGINFVCDDERARLAFCFMNSVMSEKRRNEKDEDLKWREFQMAFILQSMRGVAGHDKQMQEFADVLWFPTGGGKTEAYLGIIVFAMAYRRLMKADDCKDDDGEIFNNDGGVNVISRYTLRLLTIQQFQRSLGVTIVSDLRRIENWIPHNLRESSSIVDQELNDRFQSGNLWGKTRFSIGLWIGADSTPSRFAWMKGNKGKIIPNAEWVLLSSRDSIKKKGRSDPPKGDPAQIQNCPICKKLLCFPQNKTNKIPKESEITWIIKTRKTNTDLESIPKQNFSHPHKTVVVNDGPFFSDISQLANGDRFVRVTMKISMSKTDDVRSSIDGWWDDIVKKHFRDDGIDPLASTRASMPGYFFLYLPGENRPYDFAIHCTDKNCVLNKTRWFEDRLKNNYSIPEAFLEKGNKSISNSVPISAFTVDEQVYVKCPTFIIATADKFANLPWEPKCASLFGNVDCNHPFFGFGRREIFQGSILNKKQERIKPKPLELTNVDRFLPPSLIIQDELHLIEGPLGSMVGVYEMALDALCMKGSSGPKYIASSATIKEAHTQIRTIFRKDIRIFPPPGISASDNFFAKTDEDPSCIEDGAGRLYVGICSGKSVFELPIKICAVLMSEIHKIKENPGSYGITKEKVDDEIDPYWTYVSYFSDLQLMSRFGGFYGDDIKIDVKKFCPSRLGNGHSTGTKIFSKGIRIIPITVNEDFTIHGISIYCQDITGNISVSLYENSDKDGNLIWNSESKKCSKGENSFDSTEPIRKLKKGETIWVGVLNDDSETKFSTVTQKEIWYETLKNPVQDEMSFQPHVGKTKEINADAIQVELVGKRRNLESEESMIQLSSETSSEDLPKYLEMLNDKLSVDALLTSPVFGTGIDVDRLGLMNIMTQPKTTSGYIQATGRVGRTKPGLVVTWFSARRARDIDHYENFIGYHRKIHSYVEPITANPFSKESLELCLGPIIVSILRNGKKVYRTPINSRWITDPMKILSNKNGSSPEINSVKDCLSMIASSDLIPAFRKNENFEHIFGIELRKWLKLAENYDPKDVIYGERNPAKPVNKNVVLGSPFHEQRGFATAFRNTRNSLRDTESTSMFYKSPIQIPIRPFQFITKYGPGSFLPADICSVTSPSISDMMGNLNSPIGNFDETVNGKKGLKKIEIHDSKMIKMLRRFNKGYTKDIRIFSMPTNASLNSMEHPIADYDKIYEAKIFPEWAICSKHTGDRILSKIIIHPRNRKPVVRCPSCQAQFDGDMYSDSFSSVRFVMACKNGHMSDVEWNKIVHKKNRCNLSGDDEYRVFIWDETGSGDDTGFNCYGVWTGIEKNVFKRTTCNAQTKYSIMKHDSSEGLLECQKTFVEDSEKPEKSCDASSKITRKSMMSLRSPIIFSSLVIQQKRSELFEKLWPYTSEFLLAKKYLQKRKSDWTPEDLASELTEDMNITEIDKLLIDDIKNEEKQNLERIADDLKKDKEKENSEEKTLSEYNELEEELRNLEKGVGNTNQTRHGNGQKTPKSKFPIHWKNSNFDLSFEAMPFSDIHVTMVQTGYSREIMDTLQEKEEDESKNILQLREGKTIRNFSRFDDPDTNICWYLGNQSIGEGIFIHLDPKKHKDNFDVFRYVKGNVKEWNTFHKKITEIGDKEMQRDLSEEQIDLIESVKTKSNPLFVWWHTLAHKIISELSIDSGFVTTALRERIYCIQNDDGSYSTGILIYVSTPGSDGTLGGLTSLVDDEILPKIVDTAINRLLTCSNDPVCSERGFTPRRHRGAACHACIMAPETSCSYQNKFLDRNIVKASLI